MGLAVVAGFRRRFMVILKTKTWGHLSIMQICRLDKRVFTCLVRPSKSDLCATSFAGRADRHLHAQSAELMVRNFDAPPRRSC